MSSQAGNWSTRSGQSGSMILIPQTNSDLRSSPQVVSSDTRRDDMGAGYYVIVVILVYGMSIVALIASHIKRKHSKLLEDRQIHKYLKEFQVVRETSSRDTYRSLKRSIVDKLSHVGSNDVTFAMHSTTSTGGRGSGRRRSSSGCSTTSNSSINRCLSRAVLPLTAPLGLPANICSVGVIDEAENARAPRQRHAVARQYSASGNAPDGSSAVGSSRHRLERRRHALRIISPMTSSPSPLTVHQDDTTGIDREANDFESTYVIPTARTAVPVTCHNCRMQLMVNCEYPGFQPASDFNYPADVDARTRGVMTSVPYYHARSADIQDTTLAAVNHVRDVTPSTRGSLKPVQPKNIRLTSADDRRTILGSGSSRPRLMLHLQSVNLPSEDRRNSSADRYTIAVSTEDPMTVRKSLTNGDIHTTAAAVHVTSL